MSMLYLRYINNIYDMERHESPVNDIQKWTKEKHRTIKFNFPISPTKIAFLDMMLYKDKNNKIQTTLFCKPESEHPRSLKNCIPYSQALRLETICTTTTEYYENCTIIKRKFLDMQYKEVLDEQI